MKNETSKSDAILEANLSEPTQSRGPKLIYKLMFFAVGILSALTICILIQLSNNLTMEKKIRAFRHFEEIASHEIEQQNHSS